MSAFGIQISLQIALSNEKYTLKKKKEREKENMHEVVQAEKRF